MTTATATLANRMIQRINEAITHKLSLPEMFEYVEQDFDLNNREVSNLFNQVFFANFKMDQFAN